ncbi:MAG: phosphotransferase family protein, partial [Nitriliruptorales bacterium]|nr:phosphotransferase family protein [Nitriliruptorales bacterium]
MELATELGRYLSDVLKADGPVGIAVGAQNEEAGFSSETTVYTATWTTGGESHEQRQVLKLEPSGVTVFKDTDVSRQVRAMRAVADNSSVPVPHVVALETDSSILGAPFYVMEAVEGLVPPDNPPFSTGGWIFEASEEDQRRLHTSGLDAVADLHAIDPAVFSFLDRPEFGEPGPDQMLGQWEDMLAWGRADEPLPIIDHAMTWLREHQPDDEAAHDIRLSWGDSRISNIIWQDFRPAAIIDWEMVELAPPAADVVWYRHIDRTMESATDSPRLPGFLDLDEIVGHYEARTDRTLTNIHWYEVYAAVRFGVVMMRIARRMVEQYDLDPNLMHNNLGVRGISRVMGIDEPGEPG